MLIRNLTSKRQEVTVKEITGECKSYDIYIEPKGTTDVERVVLVDPDKYKGILEINGKSIKVAEVIKKIETPEVVTTPESEEETAEIIEKAEEVEKLEEASDSFICDICGAEFASARGLAAHKNKIHSDIIK